LKKYRTGPLYTPPGLQGTVMLPGVIGGANWGGGAFDPENGMLYVKSSNTPALARLVKVGEGKVARSADVDAGYVMEPGASAQFHNGLPLLKPPYGQLTAIDLNQGEIVWQVPFGDDASLRRLLTLNDPALKDAKLPDRLGAAGAPGAIITRGGLIFVGGGDDSLHAVDTASGRDLWTYPLGRRTTATPMTYRPAGGHQFVVIASGSGRDARLTAFTLP
jgi:quinoprotein glucose dehydrogenase